MVKAKCYSLALEIDRTLKLSLNNDQFENLSTFLDGYEDHSKIANNLMRGTPGDVLQIVADLKKK